MYNSQHAPPHYIRFRNSCHTALLTANIWPGCIRDVGQYLATFSDNVLQSLETDENMVIFAIAQLSCDL